MEPEDRLLKLLSIKRYEHPPSGYFEQFSGRVIVRLESAEPPERIPLWSRLVASLQPRPALVWSLGGTVTALLVWGVFSANQMEQDSSVRQEAPALTRLPGAPDPVELTQTNEASQSPSLFDLFKPATRPASLDPR